VSKKVSVLLIVVAFLVIAATGCSSKAPSEAVRFVPDGANLLGRIDLNKLLTDEEITKLYEKASKGPENPQTFNEAVDWVEDVCGIDLTTFSTITFFGDTSEVAGEDSAMAVALIVQGTFDREDLLDAIEDAVGEHGIQLKSTQYKGYEIYTVEGLERALAFLGDGMLVFAPQTWAERVIDVARGDRKAVSGAVLDTYNGQKDGLLKMALETESTDQADEELPAELGGFMGDLEAFENVKTAGLTVGRAERSLTLGLKLCAADDDSAEAMEQAIRGMVSFLQMAASFSEESEIPKGLLSLLGDLDISRSGSCVIINLDMPFSEIENLIAGGVGQPQ
jgi:hypothetical protein